MFYSQYRVGQAGRGFKLWKLRSMQRSNHGLRITADGDARVTHIGHFLRKYKLDELPQFWNVLRGDMSFVGPRPEVPEYVEFGDSRWQRVLQCRPGITDFATLVYRNEEKILATFENREAGYREHVLPSKLALNIEYLDHRSLWSDIKLIALTARCSFSASDPDQVSLRRTIFSH